MIVHILSDIHSYMSQKVKLIFGVDHGLSTKGMLMSQVKKHKLYRTEGDSLDAEFFFNSSSVSLMRC